LVGITRQTNAFIPTQGYFMTALSILKIPWEKWVRWLLPLLLIWLALGMAAVIIAFITEYAVVDRIIDHLKLTFVADKPPPSHVFTEVALMEAEESGDYS
jgi:hypothetical protein